MRGPTGWEGRQSTLPGSNVILPQEQIEQSAQPSLASEEESSHSLVERVSIWETARESGTLITDLGPVIREARLAGRGYKAIARETGFPRDAIRNYCKRNGLAGERGPRPKARVETKPPKPVLCRRCGKELPVHASTGPPAQYCSSECRRAWWEEHQDQRRQYDLICKCCGNSFKSARQSRQFCSPGCSRAATRLLPDGACAVCGKTFRPRNTHQKCCSWPCGQTASKSGRPKPVARTCKRCGKTFVPKRANYATYCSRECAFADRAVAITEARARKTVPWRFGAGDASCRRRARRYGRAVERIVPLEVYERDGWKCGICGKKVDRRLRWPHPMSASLDHIVPLSRDGDHVATNVQLAHHSCNTRRHVTGAAQLRLLP